MAGQTEQHRSLLAESLEMGEYGTVKQKPQRPVISDADAVTSVGNETSEETQVGVSHRKWPDHQTLLLPQQDFESIAKTRFFVIASALWIVWLLVYVTLSHWRLL